MKVLVVVDMQNDFIDGALGSKDAQAIVDNVAYKVEESDAMGNLVIYTRDTHFDDYLETQEGKNLPVPHCIWETKGWEISDKVYREGCPIVNKSTFGASNLAQRIEEEVKIRWESSADAIEEIELIGLCTDICVISNAMLLKAAFPEIPIKVDSSCCAGVTPESHATALNAMKAVQINVV